MIKFFLYIMTISILSSCAYTHVADDGTKYIIGLVNLKIKPSNSNEQLAGDSVSITSVGISFYSTPIHNGFTVGYNNEDITTLRQNSLVFSSDLKLSSSKTGPSSSHKKEDKTIE